MLVKKVFVSALSVLLILGSFSSRGFSQTTASSRLSGTVTDSAGAVVANADIVIKNNETGVEFKLKSGEDGSFNLPSLPLATYTVTVSYTGFKTTTVTNVKTIIGDTVSVDVKLEAGAASESITVTAGAAVAVGGVAGGTG